MNAAAAESPENRAGAVRRATFHAFERTCSLPDARTAAFPARALHLLEGCTGIDARLDGRHLVVGAETEDCFDRPLAILRAAFGAALRVAPLDVRIRRRGTSVETPVMGVQVRCTPSAVDAVRRDLQRRGGRVLEAARTGCAGVVRAAVPAAALIGYARQLAELAGPGARATLWPSHWEPAPSDPPSA